MIDTVTVNGQSNLLFTPDASQQALSQRLDTTFSRLIEIAEDLAEISEAANRSVGIATVADSRAEVGPGVDRTLNMQYKFEGIPAELLEVLEPPTGYTPGAHRGQLSGFNHDKFSPDHPNSMNRKYVSARVFEQIDVNDPDAIGKAVARLQELGFNVSAVGGDKIDFNDGGAPVDVIRNSSGSASGSRAWQWLT